MCAGRALDLFKEQAKKRQVESGGNHGNQYTKLAVLPLAAKPPEPTNDEILENTHKSEPFHAHK